ncbi:hypothetical protein N9B94_03865 [Verrucomicrobia bacterium]|nr:hypothetical protein [Verrucomicrobiota bacterium]
MTIDLERKEGGGIQLRAQAWRVREMVGSKNIPKKEFAREFRTLLKKSVA